MTNGNIESVRYHLPIMSGEVVDFLSCRPGGVYVDCTVGGGGHAIEVLKAISPDGRLIGIDRDMEAIEESRKFLHSYSSRVTLVQSDFRELKDILSSKGLGEVDGILIDLGVSSRQLDKADRGFSFMREGPLDMRMDQSSGEKASELLLKLSAGELASILKRYGEERWARVIARAIKAAGEISTTVELAAVVSSAVPVKFHPRNIHVATRTFQALRIAVNEELLGLDSFIMNVPTLLKKGGRVAVISFHSLEDRIVKLAFRALSKRCICPPDLPYCSCDKEAIVKVITKKPVTPTPEEIGVNPRSRSAKLRVAERI